MCTCVNGHDQGMLVLLVCCQPVSDKVHFTCCVPSVSCLRRHASYVLQPMVALLQPYPEDTQSVLVRFEVKRFEGGLISGQRNASAAQRWMNYLVDVSE